MNTRYIWKSKENDKNTIFHTVNQVKVVKVKEFEKKIENQNSASPTSPQNQPSQRLKVCIVLH